MDPIYTFRKGEGWVATVEPEWPTYYFEHSGKNWVLEYRDPKPGEWFVSLSRYYEEEDIKRLIDIITRSRYKPTSYYQCGNDNMATRLNRRIVYREA